MGPADRSSFEDFRVDMSYAEVGERPGVVAAAPWDEIDLNAGEWHVPAGRMKMRHDHVVPLAKQAVALLGELQSLTGRGHYVFPSPSRQKTPHLHRDALSKALREMVSKGKHATHGFRGMLRTVDRERLGIDIDVLEAQLAHAKRGDVQKAYDRTTFDASSLGALGAGRTSAPVRPGLSRCASHN